MKYWLSILYCVASICACDAPNIEDPSQSLATVKEPVTKVVKLPTYASFDADIAPLLKTHCLSCHDSGRQAPDLTSYNAMSEANCGLAKSIVSEVKERDMPKIHRLSLSEIEAFKKWQASGFPKMAEDQTNSVLCSPN